MILALGFTTTVQSPRNASGKRASPGPDVPGLGPDSINRADAFYRKGRAFSRANAEIAHPRLRVIVVDDDRLLQFVLDDLLRP